VLALLLALNLIKGNNMSVEMHEDVIVKTEVQTDLKEPSMFRVVYKNDNRTTVDFVVQSCVDHFNYTVEDGMQLAEKIHNNGSAVVAVLPHEIAEQKGADVTVEARAQGLPLVVRIEKD